MCVVRLDVGHEFDAVRIGWQRTLVCLDFGKDAAPFWVSPLLSALRLSYGILERLGAGILATVKEPMRRE
jgi:hypothetical protein